MDDVEGGIDLIPDDMRALMDGFDPTFLDDIGTDNLDSYFPTPSNTDSDGSINGRRGSSASSSEWSHEDARNVTYHQQPQYLENQAPQLFLADPVMPDPSYRYFDYKDESSIPFPSPTDSCPSISPTRISSPPTQLVQIHPPLKPNQKLILAPQKSVEPVKMLIAKPLQQRPATTHITPQPLNLIPVGRTLSAEEQKKIRNRHFAQQSREKKKKAAQAMESELQRVSLENDQLRKENHRLRTENSELRARCGLAHIEVPRMKPNGRTVKAVAGGTFFVFALVFVAGIFTSGPSNDTEFTVDVPSRVLKVDPKLIEALPAEYNATANSTDFQVLGNMLDSWVSRHSAASGGAVRFGSMQRLLVNETGVMPRTSSGERKRDQAKQKAIRDRAWKHLDLLNTNSTRSSLIKSQVAGGIANLSREGRIMDRPFSPTIDEQLYTDLARAVQRRKDTLYLFGGQYLLMPSETRDPAIQPKFSLIVPALAPNATDADPIVSMLRIDCNVIATSLFNIPKEYLLF
ncbi:unnamed protein product, partial [Mesorhabditis spiculigera]